MGLSLWELPPGEAAYPYHYHLAEEELVLVLDGQPSLRTPDGWRELQEGEVVPFLRGEQGGHQLVNRTEDTVRFLAFSTNGEPDIVLYPDSDKLGAFERLPPGAGLRAMFRLSDTVDYHEGEQPPGHAVMSTRAHAGHPLCPWRPEPFFEHAAVVCQLGGRKHVVADELEQADALLEWLGWGDQPVGANTEGR